MCANGCLSTFHTVLKRYISICTCRGSFHKSKLTVIESKFTLDSVECKWNSPKHYTISHLRALFTGVDPKCTFSATTFFSVWFLSQAAAWSACAQRGNREQTKYKKVNYLHKRVKKVMYCIDFAFWELNKLNGLNIQLKSKNVKHFEK